MYFIIPSDERRICPSKNKWTKNFLVFGWHFVHSKKKKVMSDKKSVCQLLLYLLFYWMPELKLLSNCKRSWIVFYKIELVFKYSSPNQGENWGSNKNKEISIIIKSSLLTFANIDLRGFVKLSVCLFKCFFCSDEHLPLLHLFSSSLL